MKVITDKIIELAYSFLKGVVSCDYPHVNFRNEYAMDVKIDGDWKHDHLCAKWILEEQGFSQLGETEIYSDGDDFYTSIHHFIYTPKEQ